MPRSHIAIIGAPLDLGQGRRGVDMGPSAIRVANLNKRLYGSGIRSTISATFPWISRRAAAGRARTGQVSAADCARCKRLAGMVERRLQKEMPLVLGGDHSVAAGTVPAFRGISGGRSSDRSDLDRCACRYEYARQLAERQRAWHAAGVFMGMGPPELANLLGYAPKVNRARRCWWDCATWICWRRSTCAIRAYARSRCATSMNADCAP